MTWQIKRAWGKGLGKLDCGILISANEGAPIGSQPSKIWKAPCYFCEGKNCQKAGLSLYAAAREKLWKLTRVKAAFTPIQPPSNNVPCYLPQGPLRSSRVKCLWAKGARPAWPKVILPCDGRRGCRGPILWAFIQPAFLWDGMRAFFGALEWLRITVFHRDG